MCLSYRYLLPVLTALCCLGISANAQSRKFKPQPLSPERLQVFEDYAAQLRQLCESLYLDSVAEKRVAAAEAIRRVLPTALSEPDAQRYRFPQIDGLSILAPPDSSFRVFTWQLILNDTVSNYYGILQTTRTDEPRLIELQDKSPNISEYDLLTERFGPDEWYGAVYYNIRQFDHPTLGRRYLLFGFNRYGFSERRKLIEVLGFGKNGEIELGAPVFERKDRRPAYRVSLTYSAEGAVRLNYDEQYKMILFDHLIPIPNPITGGLVNVTDGSYDGYRLEKGRWIFVNKVFNDVMDEAPRPAPVLDQRKGTDLFGRKKG
ncbi:MAG: hypothetical protein ACK4NS_12285 [Saprospiraceae bacterium]